MRFLFFLELSWKMISRPQNHLLIRAYKSNDPTPAGGSGGATEATPPRSGQS